MRKQLLSVILPLLVMGLVASAAETPASQPASQRNELERVNVVRGAEAIRIEISARGAVTPKLSAETSPERVVVELPSTVMATGQSHITVDSAGVKGVRIGMDRQTPPTTRVVVDLEHAIRYDLNPSADGKLVLTLYTKSEAAAVVNPGASKNVAAQNQVASAPVASVATPKTDATTSPAATASTDFVFVEPTYEAKKATPEIATEPAGRS